MKVDGEADLKTARIVIRFQVQEVEDSLLGNSGVVAIFVSRATEHRKLGAFPASRLRDSGKRT